MSFRDAQKLRASRLPKSYTDTTGNTATEKNVPGDQSSSQVSSQAIGERSIPIDEKSMSFELPPYLEIRKTESSGRGVWAKSPIPAGSTLLSIRPSVHVLSTQHLADYCSNCTSSTTNGNEGLKKCTSCKAIRYCGGECQSADWPNHKPECVALRRWAEIDVNEGGKLGPVPGEAVRGMARLIWKRKKMGLDSKWSKQIQGMQSHPPTKSNSEAFIKLSFALVKYMCPKGPEDLPGLHIQNSTNLIELLTSFTTNTFTLTTPSLFPIGICCSPLAALSNHSCDPNSSIVFPTSTPERKTTGASTVTLPGPTLEIVAFRDVSAGDEITTPYIDLTEPTLARRKILEESYQFKCVCPICEPQKHGRSDVDWRETLICPKNCGGGCPISALDKETGLHSVKCALCGVSSNVDFGPLTHNMKLGQEALEKANQYYASGNLDQALTITKNAISLLEPFLSPSSHPLLALCSLQQSMLIAMLPAPPTPPSPDHYTMLLRVSSQIISGMQKVLRPGHPVRAIALSEAGQLLAMDDPSTSSSERPGDPTAPLDLGPQTERLINAKKILQQAFEELQLAFGKRRGGGDAAARVREALVRVENELSVWARAYKEAKADANVRGVKA